MAYKCRHRHTRSDLLLCRWGTCVSPRLCTGLWAGSSAAIRARIAAAVCLLCTARLVSSAQCTEEGGEEGRWRQKIQATAYCERARKTKGESRFRFQYSSIEIAVSGCQ